MLCICYCTNSIKLYRLLLLDSGLCIAKPWMLCICYCTNSIKLQPAAFVGFRTVYSQAMDALLLYQSQHLGYSFTACWWILEDCGWFLAKLPRDLVIDLIVDIMHYGIEKGSNSGMHCEEAPSVDIFAIYDMVYWCDGQGHVILYLDSEDPASCRTYEFFPQGHSSVLKNNTKIKMTNEYIFYQVKKIDIMQNINRSGEGGGMQEKNIYH